MTTIKKEMILLVANNLEDDARCKVFSEMNMQRLKTRPNWQMKVGGYGKRK